MSVLKSFPVITFILLFFRITKKFQFRIRFNNEGSEMQGECIDSVF